MEPRRDAGRSRSPHQRRRSTRALEVRLPQWAISVLDTFRQASSQELRVALIALDRLRELLWRMYQEALMSESVTAFLQAELRRLHD